MTQSPEDFLPEAEDWFSPTLEYVGRCRAEFSSPRGSVEGPARVTVDEAGNVEVRMVPEPATLSTNSTSTHGLMGFFGGDEFEHDLGGGVSTLDAFAQNSCTRLKVETPQGTFRTEDVLYYSTHSVMNTGEVTEANFAVGQSTFDAGGEPEYWVLPLANFLSEGRQWRPELNRHPLRVFPTPEVPDEITHVPLEHEDREALETRAVLSLHAANSKNRLIVFEFDGGLGFMERLPDYSDSETTLLEGREKHKTTAVMVGPTGGPGRSFEEMRDWFDFDVLYLLTLATGTEVGCPWVEIRNSEGQLVRRFHGYLNVEPFRKGYRLVEEIPLPVGGRKATGYLIERARSRSKEFGQSFVRVATIHLVRARYEDQSLDDQISHLARGFETLCKRYRTMGEVLSHALSPTLRDDVRDILRDAATQIRALSAGGTVGPGQRATRDQIANRVHGADQRDKPFGAAVAKLLKSFWLPDAHILENHYQNRQGGWAGILGQYRGDVTHHGYLPILEENRDVEELVAVRNHLHDALARVIFKILKFDGGYNPGIVPYKGPSGSIG